jgi:hypothetical protein
MLLKNYLKAVKRIRIKPGKAGEEPRPRWWRHPPFNLNDILAQEKAFAKQRRDPSRLPGQPGERESPPTCGQARPWRQAFF